MSTLTYPLSSVYRSVDFYSRDRMFEPRVDHNTGYLHTQSLIDIMKLTILRVQIDLSYSNFSIQTLHLPVRLFILWFVSRAQCNQHSTHILHKVEGLLQNH